MARRKCLCIKWTLVLLVVLVCPFVYSRPQESSVSSNSANDTSKSTEIPTRYRFRSRNLSFNNLRLPVVTNVGNLYNLDVSKIGSLVSFTNSENESKGRKQIVNASEAIRNNNSVTEKSGRELKKKKTSDSRNRNRNKNKLNRKPTGNFNNVFKLDIDSSSNENTQTKRKPAIRKILTKWTDSAKVQGLGYTPSYENQDLFQFVSTEDYSSTELETASSELIKDLSTEASKVSSTSKLPIPTPSNKLLVKISNRDTYRPRPDYSEESNVHTNKVHSNKVHIVDNFHSPVPSGIYLYTTPMPTPIITHVGTPIPWGQKYQQNMHNRRPTTRKPIRYTQPTNNQYNYHHVINNDYPQYPNYNTHEATTFSPVTAFTERIVIRPGEYAAPSADCPTIYLTLNNSFQGQGKEACPDLNIAVNTNVLNKNVVVESEENTDNLFPDVFGLPLDTDESAEDAIANDNYDSDEDSEGQSASVENGQLMSYHANGGVDSDTSGSNRPLAANAGLSRPNRRRPHKKKDDYDTFSISSLVRFFQPALNVLGWLGALNPLNFSVLTLLFTPLAFLLAGSTGVTGILPFAREAPEEIHILRPKWHWDNHAKTWHLDSFPDNRWQKNRLPRDSKEKKSKSQDWLYEVKQLFKYTAKTWKKLNSKELSRKSKRERRQVRKSRMKFVNSKPLSTSAGSSSSPASEANSSRDVKRKAPILGDSIKMVATQLLDNANVTAPTAIVSDSRIPPKVKNQLASKQKLKTRLEETTEKSEYGHAGIAVPITMEELESENKVVETSSESSTSNEGISTWILLSNPTAKENTSVSTEPTKVEDVTKKNKPNNNKNKTRRPQQNGNKTSAKRPIIASSIKSDLIAGGSAINDNVLNKIKDTVLSNVQKNKSNQTTTQKPTTVTSTTTNASPLVEITTTKKEEIMKTPAPETLVVKVTSKPTKKKNKIKHKQTTTTTTEGPIISDSAYLPAEAKEQEIELEISTPATTTKKPKRKSATKRKKSKTKKRKTSTKTPKPEETAIAVKTSNKTKTAKPAKKPDSPITTQIYNYLSREVMPSVGVGAIGLVGLVGLASYFLYPFATPVRRTFEVDKKDDIYRHNAEEYANDGNGQAEEEMLGTVLAGMPAHSKQKLNPYIGQMANANRYPTKKEQDLKYRHVASSYDSPNYNVHYPQQKTGIAHAAVYSESSYTPQQQQYETRHVFTTEGKYTYEKPTYTQYPAIEPIYAAPQSGPSGAASYESDTSNSVVYGVKPSAEADFKPVYPFEGQVFSDTTSNPMTYPPTSMYLGSNNEAEQQEEAKYDEENQSNGIVDNKFVVGNVPKELSETATPAVVPEHGPRNLRRRRNAVLNKPSITGHIEEILKRAKAENQDIFISNEIDEVLGDPKKDLSFMDKAMVESVATTTESNILEVKSEEKATIFPVYAVSLDSKIEVPTTTLENKFVESVSTVPIDSYTSDKTTTAEPDMSNELELTTKSFRVYEVFSTVGSDKASSIEEAKENVETTTEFRNMNTETTTETLLQKSETTSTMPSLTSTLDSKLATETILPTLKPKPTNNPSVITYPPLNGEGSFFTFLKRLVEFKYRLGLSILQTTSDSLNRYLRGMESTVQRMAKASKPL